MIRAVLLDLDDTLLDTKMERFLPLYFKALGERMKKFISPDEMIQLVLEATGIMMQNQDPAVSNREAFNRCFFSNLNYPESVVQAEIDSFYEENFPELKKYTNPHSLAKKFVQTLFDSGYKVVIATNPLFPMRAIEHRIAWAGLSEFPFNLITSYENSHFSKPNPLYYQEIVEKLNCQPSEAIMIGDDLNNDIEPANQAGLHTYWIRDGLKVGSLQGTLNECLAWIQSGGLDKL